MTRVPRRNGANLHNAFWTWLDTIPRDTFGQGWDVSKGVLLVAREEDACHGICKSEHRRLLLNTFWGHWTDSVPDRCIGRAVLQSPPAPIVAGGHEHLRSLDAYA